MTKRKKPQSNIARGCAWVQDNYGLWETDCGGHFEVNEGTPHENKMAFCCYCGRELEQYVFRDDE